jgi:CBS domain-containing protein
MTPDPKFVSDFHSAVDAMMTMIKNNFRHLPVSDESGAIIGILDIAKCLNDAITKLQRASEKSNDAAELLIKQALENAGQGGAALKAILGPLVSQGFGNQSSRSLGSILVGTPSTIVETESSVLEAAILMAESRKAALVQENGKLVGIFGFKDMMCRVIAKELDPEFTQIREVMTPNPEFVSPEMSILEALQAMHDNHFLTLPVCEDDGKIVGVVNVMDVINGCGGAEGWRAVFDSALEIVDDVSASQSASQGMSKKSPRPMGSQKDPIIKVSRDSPFVTPRGPNNIPTTLEFNEANHFDEGSFNDTFLTDLQMVTFKVVDMSGHTHRLKADTKIASLQKAFAKKIGSRNPDGLRFKFVDDEGDSILVTTDDDLLEAVKLSRASTRSSRGESPVVKLIATDIAEPTGLDPMVLVAGAGVAVAVAGLAAMYMMRPRRYY